MSKRLPTVFISHGAPTLAIEQSPAADFLRKLGQELPRPRAIVVASAHWGTAQPAVTAAPMPGTIHDFSGFPEALYQIRYPAAGDPEMAQRMVELLDDLDLSASLDTERGLDHGAWVPLSLMYPQADVRVVQLAIQPQAKTTHHYRLGQALASLRGEGVLIFGSGSVTHNLRELGAFADGAIPDWAKAFEDWLTNNITAGDSDALLNAPGRAPEFRRNHPTPEHLLPLFVPLGAADGARGRALHRSFEYGSLAMSAYAWD